MKIAVTKADRLFSQYIRAKADHRCEYCVKIGRWMGEYRLKLEASHYHSRRKKSVRYDPDNVHSLCFSCHQRMGGKGNSEYDTWMLQLLGEQRLQALQIRAETPNKPDEGAVILFCQTALKEMENV